MKQCCLMKEKATIDGDGGEGDEREMWHNKCDTTNVTQWMWYNKCDTIDGDGDERDEREMWGHLIPSVEGFRKINVDCLQSISVDFFCQIFTICNAGNLDRKIIDSEIGNSSKYPNFESSASNFLFRIGSLVWSENAANMGIVEVALKKVEQQGTLLLKQINSFKKEIKSKIWRKFLGDISGAFR